MGRLIGNGLISVPFYEDSDELSRLLLQVEETGSWNWNHCCPNLSNYLCEWRSQWIKDLTARLESGSLADHARECEEGTSYSKEVACELMAPRLGKQFAGYDDNSFLAAAAEHSQLGSIVCEWCEKELEHRAKPYENTFVGVSSRKLMKDVAAGALPPFQMWCARMELRRRQARQSTQEENQNVRTSWANMTLDEVVAAEPAGKTMRQHWLREIVARTVSMTEIAQKLGHSLQSRYEMYTASVDVDDHARGVKRWSVARVIKQGVVDEDYRFRYAEYFYPADTLELILQGPKYLFKQAERTGVKLSPDQHRLMMAHGIQDTSNSWCKRYATMCEEKNW